MIVVHSSQIFIPMIFLVIFQHVGTAEHVKIYPILKQEGEKGAVKRIQNKANKRIELLPFYSGTKPAELKTECA